MNIRPQVTLDEFLALYAAGPDVVWAVFEELSTHYTSLEKRVGAAEARNNALQLKVDELAASQQTLFQAQSWESERILDAERTNQTYRSWRNSVGKLVFVCVCYS